jgi:hypothetical protein
VQQVGDLDKFATGILLCPVDEISIGFISAAGQCIDYTDNVISEALKGFERNRTFAIFNGIMQYGGDQEFFKGTIFPDGAVELRFKLSMSGGGYFHAVDYVGQSVFIDLPCVCSKGKTDGGFYGMWHYSYNTTFDNELGRVVNAGM